jgi:formamidopyrimidine-DNA glycosylase
MPELPEVEVLSLQLSKRIGGLRIAEVLVRRESSLTGARQGFEETLPSKRINRILRRGKFLCLELEDGALLWFHLGMTGQLLWIPRPTAYVPHVHLVVRFEETEMELVFRDPRRFGKICLTKEPAGSFPEGVRPWGPDPYEMSDEGFLKIFRGRKGRIKNLLLNQTLMAGLGNIYADESLFRAGIDPRRRAYRLNSTKLIRLHQAICETLTEAIEKGGSSIDDFLHANGGRGFFQNFHRVYGREGEKCFSCGDLVHRIRLAGRSAHFCPQCQR